VVFSLYNSVVGRSVGRLVSVACVLPICDGVERLILVIHIYWLPNLADASLIYARRRRVAL
jgi:hypothetical protein